MKTIHSRARHGAALAACAVTLSLSALTAAAPAQATVNTGGAVPAPGAVKVAPRSAPAAAYSVIPAIDTCPSNTIVKMFGNTDQVCIFAPTTVNTTGLTFTTLVSFVANRVWLHQFANGGGWADCFRDPFYPRSGAAWNVTGTRDARPGNILVSLNTATC